MSKKSKLPTIILGGGPTGLAAAYRLSLNKKPVILLEKEKNLGGLSATIIRKNFLYEYGPHAFHLKDPKITQWLKDILDDDFRVIPTKTQVLIEGKLLNYPLKGWELIRKLELSLGIRILLDYSIAYFKSLLTKKKPENFEEWGLNNFGLTLYKISFGDYTKKVWGIHPKEISPLLASQKISRLDLGDIILKLFGFKGKNQPAYFKKYLYPKNGIGQIFNKMAKVIQKNGQIISGAEVTKLRYANGKINTVEYRDQKGKNHKLKPQQIISTLTLKDLIPMINSPLKKSVQEKAKQLKYRDMIIIYFVIDRQDISKAQWVYLVENKFKFNRFTVGQNLSPLFAPKDKNVISFEICCQKGDHLWKKKNQELLKLLRKDFIQLGWKNLKIKDYWIEKIENAYPFFMVGFEKNFKSVLDDLKKINNLISTGRNGLFLNSDVHDCFQMGFESADFITNHAQTQNWYKKKAKIWLNH